MVEPPIFLERASFRRKRLGDAARVLPVLGGVAVLLPVWWLPETFSFAAGMLCLFSLWAGLIVAIWCLHRALTRVDVATRGQVIRATEKIDKDHTDAF